MNTGREKGTRNILKAKSRHKFCYFGGAKGGGEYYISNQKLHYCWAGSVLIAEERYLINKLELNTMEQGEREREGRGKYIQNTISNSRSFLLKIYIYVV